MSGKDSIQLGKMKVNANQSGCCGGKANENSAEVPEITPPHMVKPKSGDSGIDERTKVRKENEDKEARKARLAGGALAKSLLDDSKAEPLPPRIRRPGETIHPTWKPAPPPPKMAPLPPRGAKYNEALEHHLNHLPFYNHKRYDRVGILKRIKRIKPLRGLLQNGRYFIDKDRRADYDPRMDPQALEKYLKQQEKMGRRYRAEGRVNRIVELFMDKVMGWGTSRDLLPPKSIVRGSPYCFMWLGPHLARKMLHQLCAPRDPTLLFETITKEPEDKEFYIINRLPVDSFFKDKENFYGMLSQYVLSPNLVCKARSVDECLYLASLKEDCQDLESKGLVTRRTCVHQNLSLSLKPCLVSNCPNYEKQVCSHLYAFIPETITLNSYTSMLHFSERFQRVEDLKGTIFITKPAYLCNGRGIKFIVELDQFEHFFHMLDGKSTTRHGVVLQRYIECPRLFDRQKFTIRFFLLIIVLEKRRVLGFIHYGIAIFARLPYETVEREDFLPEEEAKEGKKPNLDIPITKRSIGRVTTDKFPSESHLTNYMSPARKARIRQDIFTGRAKMMQADRDNAFYLEEILPNKCNNTASIYIQMLFVGQCILDYMQPIVQDFAGTFQTISIDSLVDARNKLWVLEAGTNIFSGLLTIAPRQRQMMSAIIQESVGITLECVYKTRNNLPLYWDYMNDREDYDAIYFSQDFNLFYETEWSRQSGAIFERRPPPKHLLLEERYEQVDNQRAAAADRRVFNFEKKKSIVRKREEYIAMVKAKHEEES
ncbi:hypothetical protein BOX15_Mlig027040g2 [Macrostomum lignano]|uniref:Uncharacterized protein n=1 Tax=Macrostomum lignano TaxID=282301 RepID=A0A267EUL1_9PLAT|nr:hypothetical protein BOX15_Mlig027040g2 [Macrostomum lignano]